MMNLEKYVDKLPIPKVLKRSDTVDGSLIIKL
jgi:hypothetical protein